MINAIFQVLTIIILSIFLWYGIKKQNSKDFIFSIIIIAILFFTAWRFFENPINDINIMIAEFLVMTGFMFIFFVFQSLSKYKKYEDPRLYLILSIYPLAVYFHPREEVVIISTCFFILYQVLFKILIVRKIKQLRFRKRLDRFYTIFFYFLISDDVIGILCLMNLINHNTHELLEFIWNIIVSVLIVYGSYTMIKIKDVR